MIWFLSVVAVLYLGAPCVFDMNPGAFVGCSVLGYGAAFLANDMWKEDQE